MHVGIYSLLYRFNNSLVNKFVQGWLLRAVDRERLVGYDESIWECSDYPNKPLASAWFYLDQIWGSRTGL